MDDYFSWINSLCHRFHHLTQVYMSKNFNYDFDLAYGASRHSEYMAQQKNLSHSDMNGFKAENIDREHLLIGDEEALRNAIECLMSCQHHRRNMERFDTIGIGIAVDNSNKTIYITQRFR